MLLGDFNFQDQNLSWIRSDAGHLVPRVHGHRLEGREGSPQVRQQAANLCDLALKHNLIQQVDQVTHGKEILDLIFVNNEDLVSSIVVTPWPAFTDHSIVTAATSYSLKKEKIFEETHLLDSGKKLKRLNFSKANWVDIKSELSKVDWSPMQELAKTCPTSAHSWFMDKIIPILEALVPVKSPKQAGLSRHRITRKRKLLWRKLRKLQRKIDRSGSDSKLSKLLQDKWGIEIQLKTEYSAQSMYEEEKAVLNMKKNPKAFFSFAKSRQKTKARIGPFLDPSTGQPNPDPDFATSVLSDQYKSVFVKPRPDWVVENPSEFFRQENLGPIPNFSDILFTELDMEIACSDLDASSAAGADGVPASLLKFCRKKATQYSLEIFFGPWLYTSRSPSCSGLSCPQGWL